MTKTDYEDIYSRQILVLGRKSQEKLRDTSILIAGVGGLGSIVSYYLASAGIGNITIVDIDTVSLSDLNRQILYDMQDIGKYKIFVAKEKLLKIAPNANIDAYNINLAKFLSGTNKKFDLIIDCLDNIPSRIELDKFACKTETPLIHGGVEGLSGQIYIVYPKKTPCLRCLLNKQFQNKKRIIPILGPTAGIIGSLQALEAIKIITGHGKPLINKMLIFDGYSLDFSIIDLKLDDKCYEMCYGDTADEK